MDAVWNNENGIIPRAAYPSDNYNGYLVITDGVNIKAVTQKEEITIPNMDALNEFCANKRIIKYKAATITPKYHLKNAYVCLVVAQVNDKERGWIVYNIQEAPYNQVYASEYYEPGEWVSPIIGSVSFDYKEGLNIFIASLQSLIHVQKCHI